MTWVASTERVEMGATQADLGLGVGPEIARPALRPRLAGDARHLHKHKSHPHEKRRQRVGDGQSATF
jgi:hypothetical protein